MQSLINNGTKERERDRYLRVPARWMDGHTWPAQTVLSECSLGMYGMASSKQNEENDYDTI